MLFCCDVKFIDSYVVTYELLTLSCCCVDYVIVGKFSSTCLFSYGASETCLVSHYVIRLL